MISIKEVTNNTYDPINSKHAWLFFSKHLQGLGLRLTKTRKIIFDHIIKKNAHFDAETISQELAVGKCRVSRATVYATLELIKESGLIRCIHNIDKHKHYEVRKKGLEHQHMKCSCCGKVIEFVSEELTKMTLIYCEANNFTPQATNLIITGLCKDCFCNENKQALTKTEKHHDL